MEISFVIIDRDGDAFEEDELLTEGAGLGALLTRLGQLRGGLTVEDETSGNDAFLVDDFDPLLRGVCLRAVPELAAGKPVIYDYAETPASAVFTPSGDQVTVETPDAAPTQFALQPLLGALVDCGARYTELKRLQLADQPGLAKFLAGIEADLAAAEKAVGR